MTLLALVVAVRQRNGLAAIQPITMATITLRFKLLSNVGLRKILEIEHSTMVMSYLQISIQKNGLLQIGNGAV